MAAVRTPSAPPRLPSTSRCSMPIATRREQEAHLPRAVDPARLNAAVREFGITYSRFICRPREGRALRSTARCCPKWPFTNRRPSRPSSKGQGGPPRRGVILSGRRPNSRRPSVFSRPLRARGTVRAAIIVRPEVVAQAAASRDISPVSSSRREHVRPSNSRITPP